MLAHFTDILGGLDVFRHVAEIRIVYFIDEEWHTGPRRLKFGRFTRWILFRRKSREIAFSCHHLENGFDEERLTRTGMTGCKQKK